MPRVVVLVFCLSAWSVAPLLAAQTTELDHSLFLRAENELKTGAGPRYRALRERLEAHPLAVYLDFKALLKSLHGMPAEQALAFIEQASATPLARRFTAAYLRHQGQDKRWQAFLSVSPDSPRDAELQCYFYRAQWQVGDRELARSGARSLWNIGASQESACDPLFEVWRAEGGLTDELVWSRALLAFDARSGALLRYLKRFASSELSPLMDELITLYQYPERLLSDAHAAEPLHSELLSVVIQRLAKVNPVLGQRAVRQATDRGALDAQQQGDVEYAVLRSRLLDRDFVSDDWLIATLARLQDDTLTEMYLRHCIGDGRWSDFVAAYQWLGSSSANDAERRYWLARAMHALGDTAAAEPLFSALSQERHYYGFLAAERLDRPAVMAAEAPPTAAPVAQSFVFAAPEARRVSALLALSRDWDARAEWLDWLARLDTADQVVLADWALDQGWLNLAIDAANSAGAWDRLDLRFPRAYTPFFAEAARRHRLEAEWLLSIARRESALYPHAESSRGARGLMQLLPSTARRVAQRQGVAYRRSQLTDPALNIRLGSAYVAELSARFDGNMVLALAAYNAGPHRVARWQSGTLDVERWIATIPFYETRAYVEAVLAYRVVYHALGQRAVSVLSETERAARY
jgi:soluble lytic murein transglycosylase